MHGAWMLVRPRLTREWTVRMLDVVTDRVFRALNSNDVLLLTLPALENQPVLRPISLIFVSLDKIPPQYKVFGDIVDAVTDHTHGHIMPGHTSKVSLTQLVLRPVIHLMEIHDPIIVEVLTREHLVLNASRMYISTWMLPVIPASKT